MSTPPNNEDGRPARGWSRSRSLRLGIGVLVAAGIVVVAYAALSGGGNRKSVDPTVNVRKGPLVISVTESGTVQNRDRAVVKSEVEGNNSILFLVAEGTNVKAGDLLVELDSSRLAEDTTQQQITVLNSEATFIRARENLAVTQSQSASDIAKAELAYKFAQQDLTKYMEGEYPRELQKAEAEANIASEELERASDKLEWSQKLEGEGYITPTELKADELSAKRAKINLDLALSAMALLKEYTYQRNLDQLQSDLEQAREALERTKRKASADLVQAEAELKARQSEFDRQKTRLKKMDDQIGKCRIMAPVSGMVVYATTGQGNRWRNVEPLEEGQQVRERQELIYLPTDTAMMVEVKIHEASLRKIRRDMPVRVTVDALPGSVYWGRVGKIGLLPDAQSAWLNPDLKVYSTEIEIEDDSGALRPGMTCRAEILVEQYEDALYLPVQSVARVGGRTVVYLPGEDGPRPKAVEIGLDNNSMVRITEGLEEDQEVLLAPPLAASAAAEEALSAQMKLMKVPPTATAPAPQAAAPTREAESQPALDLSKLGEMSPEERRRAFEKMTPEDRRRMFENITPEQRERMRRMRPGRGGPQGQRPGGGRG
jgi:HlyD family secretion protein